MRQEKLRDRFVEHACNFLLRHVATKEYLAYVWVVTDKGRTAVASMVQEWAKEGKH